MALLLADLPYTVPGITLNRLCASGMQAISSASRMIKFKKWEPNDLPIYTNFE